MYQKLRTLQVHTKEFRAADIWTKSNWNLLNCVVFFGRQLESITRVVKKLINKDLNLVYRGLASCHLLFETLLVWRFVTPIINSYLFHIQITFSHFIFLFWINETAIPVYFFRAADIWTKSNWNLLNCVVFNCRQLESITRVVKKLINKDWHLV